MSAADRGYIEEATTLGGHETKWGAVHSQLIQLLESLPAEHVRETADRVYFDTGKKHHELHKDFPQILIIETSSFCNLVCMGCPQKDLTRKRGFIDVDVFKRVVDEAVAYDSRTWLHFMGEPLMHPRIFEMIEYAAERGLGYFGISTNALLLSDENIDRILDSGLQRFEISLDAIDPELFALLRPGGSPERIIENAHEFFRRKYARGQEHPITSVSTRVMKQNAAHTREFTEYWNAILQPPDFILAIAWNTWGGHEGLDQATWEVTIPRVPCLKLWTTAFVLSDGMVVTCDPMWNGQVPMGNVTESSLFDIWNGDVYRERRQAHLDGRYEELAVCDNCTDWFREVSEETHRNLSSEADLDWAEIRALVSGDSPG